MPEALFQNDTLYRTLLDNLSEGVYFTDTHRHIQYWNKALSALRDSARRKYWGAVVPTTF